MNKPLKLVPTIDQNEVLRFALSHPYSILAMRMGMGKSFLAVAIKNSLKNPRCVIVTTASLIKNFVKEIHKSIDGEIVTVFSRSKDVYYPIDSDFVVTSYDIFRKHPFLAKWATCIIFDECHYLKELKAKRTEEIHKILYESYVPRVHLMSGSPIKNAIREYYSLVSICHYNPRLEKSDFLDKYPNDFSFARKFSKLKKFKMEANGKKFTINRFYGLKNEEELRSIMKYIYISKKSKFGPTVRKEVWIDTDLLNIPGIEEKFKKFIDLGIEGTTPTEKAMAALHTVDFTIAYCKMLLESGDAGPLVIFSDHVESANKLADAFGTVAMTGAMPAASRQKLVDDFQSGKKDVIVGTTKTMGEGYTMIRSSNTVFNDLPWVPEDLAQAEARTNRMGQTERCTSHIIMGFEQASYLLKTLEDKIKVLEKVF